MWRGDICAVVVKEFFVYQTHIVPACIEFVDEDSEKYPKDDTMALVAGWGLSKVQGYWAPSDILQSLDIPVVNSSYCYKKAPFDFKDKVIEDKVSIVLSIYYLN